MDKKNVIKYIILIVGIVLIFAFFAHMLNRGETLAEYADNHPEEQIDTTSIETDSSEEVIATAEAFEDVSSLAEETTTSVVTEAQEETTVDIEEVSELRVDYAEGFYYDAIPVTIRDKMKGVSYPLDIDESQVCYDDLRYLSVKFVDFEGETQSGEMICNATIAQDLIEIFYELYQAEYRIEKIRLIDEYDANDTASMSDNNTSCFCYRVVDGSTHLSKHAYGLAVDLNPFYNPYVVFKTGEDDYISPPGSEVYADRSQSFPYKIDESDLAYRLFTAHGFKWGGNWNSCKDYQHFQK